MIKLRIAAVAGLLICSTALAEAQQAPATLSLDEAVQLARRYSPGYRARLNDEGVADWNLRAAYAGVLPTFGVNGNVNWRAGGERRVEGVNIGDLPDQVLSSYGIGLALRLDAGTFLDMSEARARREETRARIAAAEYSLEADVTRQYLAAMRARDGVVLARRSLEAADEVLKLAEARVAAGASAPIEASQPTVERGRAEVALIQAQAAEELEKLRLMQRIGLDPGQQVELTSTFTVFQPAWSLEELTTHALSRHPQLMAARASESASRAGARTARLAYLPSLNLSYGWGGFTQKTLDEDFLVSSAEASAVNRIEACERTNDLYSRLAQPLPPQDCSQHTFTDAARASVLASNRLFPFDFTRLPPSFNLSFSLPVHTGFSREAQLQQAVAAADDAKHARRELELQIRTEVAASYLALQTVWRTAGIEERNVAAAAEQLELASERYRLGAGSILELTQAQATKALADQSQLAAFYAFHESLAALEAAVGRPLR
jgi:outer membrane protein